MKKFILLILTFFILFSVTWVLAEENNSVSVAKIEKNQDGCSVLLDIKENVTNYVIAYYNSESDLLYADSHRKELFIPTEKEVEFFTVFAFLDSGECTFLKVQVPKIREVNSFIIHSKWNEGLVSDIYPYFKDGVYYLFMPENVNKKNVVYTTYDENGYIIKSHTFTFGNDNTEYVNIGYERYKVVFMRSSLPSAFIEINDEFGTIDDVHASPDHSVKAYGDIKISVPKAFAEEKEIDLTFESVENDETSPATLEIKGRGHTSWQNAKNGKYPYQIKLEKKAEILGMDKSKKWILIKDDADIYRNAFAFDMAKFMGLSYTPDYEFIDLYINGEYKGVYIICEKIEVDSGRVDIPDIDKDPSDMTGGYLLEIDNGADELQFDSQKNNITVKSPEKLADFVSSSNEYSYIVNHTRKLMDAIYNHGTAPEFGHFTEHIDLKSFSLYFWHQEFFGNLDCGSGSTYFYKMPDSMGGLYYMGPVWDNDYTFSEEEGWVVPNLNRGNYENGDPTMFKALCQYEEFVNYAISVFEEEQIIEKLDMAESLLNSYYDITYKSVLMNEIKFGNNNLGKLERLKKLSFNRAIWLKNNYAELKNFITKGESFKKPL